MNNTKYHSTVPNKTPMTAAKKSDIQNWLQQNNIGYEESMLKAQLLALVTQ